MNIFVILLIFIILTLLIAVFSFIFAKKFSKGTVQCYTGSLGQGKTLIAVNRSVKKLKRNRLLWLLGILRNTKSLDNYVNLPLDMTKKDFDIFRKKIKIEKGLPMLYSNIPIVIKNSLFISVLAKLRGIKIEKFESSKLLTFQHLTTVHRIREYSVTFLDEIGQIANQYSFDNPLVIQYLQSLVRFYRHFIDGLLIFTDQVSSNISKPIRTRIGYVFNLNNFRRFWFFFYKVNVQEIAMTEDIQSVNIVNNDDSPYYFGLLPFKLLKFLDITRLFTYKKYETRCYFPLYDNVMFNDDLKSFDIKNLYTKYVIDLPNNSDMKKEFKANGFIKKDKMLEYLKDWQNNVYDG